MGGVCKSRNYGFICIYKLFFFRPFRLTMTPILMDLRHVTSRFGLTPLTEDRSVLAGLPRLQSNRLEY